MFLRTVLCVQLLFSVFLDWSYCLNVSDLDTIFEFYNNTDLNQSCISNQPCVRKCCPESFIYSWTPRKNCVPSENSNLYLDFYNGQQLLYENGKTISVFTSKLICKPGYKRFRLFPDMNKADEFYLQENGTLYFPKRAFPENFVNLDESCVETFVSDNVSFISGIVCVGNSNLIEEEETSAITLASGMIISMPFLLATFLVYLALPDRSLHQKALMFYVINLLLAYIFLVIIQLSQTHIELGPCKFLGFGTLYCFISSFFWMNVICVDIWYTFSGTKGFVGSRKASERRRFIYYMIYACGTPFIHTIIALIINENADPEEWYFPGITAVNCFLGKNAPQLLYFYWLVALLTATNIILFSFTALKIKKLKQETSILKRQDSKRHVYENDKQKFNLYLKLLFGMGVNWSMEFISFVVIWAHEDVPDELWYFTDFCNALYGVFIFFIFVFKKKMWRVVQKRYYTFIGKPHLAPSMTTTYTTQTSYSSTRKTSMAGSSVHSENIPINESQI